MIIIYVFIDILEIVTPIIIIIGVTIIVIVIIDVIIVVIDATIIVIVIIVIVINLLAVPRSLLLSFPPPLRRGDRGRRHKGKDQTAIYKYVNIYIIPYSIPNSNIFCGNHIRLDFIKAPDKHEDWGPI